MSVRVSVTVRVSLVWFVSWILLAQTAISRFVPPFVRLRGNVHGSSMARWKARGRLPIGDNWTFFTSYHGWGAMSRYWSKLRYLTGGGSLWTKLFWGKGASPTNEFWHQKTRVPGLSYGEKKLPKISTGWVGRTNVMHRQTTDRRICDSI